MEGAQDIVGVGRDMQRGGGNVTEGVGQKTGPKTRPNSGPGRSKSSLLSSCT